MSAHHAGTRGVPRAEREVQILDAATALFGEHGYQGTSLGAIAERADVSKSLVLSYFGCKDDLYRRCVERLGDRMLERVLPVMEHSEPGLGTALDTLVAMFELVRHRPRDWLIIYDPARSTGSPVADLAAEYRDRLICFGATGIRTMLEDAGNGEVDPLDVSAMSHVWQSIVFAIMSWWFEHPEETPETLTARCLRILGALLSDREL